MVTCSPASPFPNPVTDPQLLNNVDWNEATISLVVTGLIFTLLQVWWISALLRRNKRRRAAEPLSSSEFRRELERIFKS